ncbi:MAG: deoxyribonuclease IV [Nitrospinota bacterium]
MSKIINDFDSRPFGAHMSIAKGLFNAVERGANVGCRAIQIFSKNSNQWRAAPLTETDIEKFRSNIDKFKVDVVAIHDSYLINLASEDPVKHEKSLNAFIDEVDRADLLGVPYLVFHPGSHLGAGEEIGVERVADSLNQVFAKRADLKVNLAIETTAGQGTNLGYTFEQIGNIIDRVDRKEKVSVCFDTCHVYAAGYDFSTLASYKKTFASFDSAIGLEYLKLFHINDSKKPLSSRVDRHEHIGEGMLGPEPFKLLLNDERFFNTPMILETPKGIDNKADLLNLARLKSYITK